ncbi:MAG TPA: tRNA pseudouridine(55) synthase TruB [Burkholderiales bacterium]|nr:tRNA pseudouridine(55) synthase TruB [Burkholderiales bacterium]
MTGPGAPRRRVDGVLLLDKPQGITSQAAVTRVKRLYNAQKAGHTGTLDPMATGLLPIALGEATKFSGALLDAEKTYEATIRLGVTTTTGDLEGAIVRTCAPGEIDSGAVERVLHRFRGDIVQMPPMYSALKHAGKPMYEYARKGVEIERAPRQVTISSLTLDTRAGADLKITVSCSKGTYIRVLAEDIGSALACGACLAALRRTRAGHVDISGAVALEALEGLSMAMREARLLPVDAMVSQLPAHTLDDAGTRRVGQGMSVPIEARELHGLVRIYSSGGIFLGLGHAAEGRLQPRRMIASDGA